MALGLLLSFNWWGLALRLSVDGPRGGDNACVGGEGGEQVVVPSPSLLSVLIVVRSDDPSRDNSFVDSSPSSSSDLPCGESCRFVVHELLVSILVGVIRATC